MQLIKLLKEILSNLMMILLSIILTLFLLEFILKKGLLDDSLIYIPKKDKELDNKINYNNCLIAEKNIYHFNDIPRSIERKQGFKRIAVLGDSFIWGDGVTYDVIWSHKLEKMLCDKYDNIEVLSWGYNGWNTYRELLFFSNEGKKYDIDMLILGFVTNDTDLNNSEQKYFHWQESPKLNFIKKTFPTLFDFTSSYINRFLEKTIYKDYGYENWEEKLYTEDNLKEYKKILNYLKKTCDTKGIKLLFVFTPNNYREYFRNKHDKIIPLLKENNIDYLDLYPAIYKRLHSYKLKELWSNKANGHPGDLVTQVYAEEVFQHITNEEHLKKIFKGEQLTLHPKNKTSNYIDGKTAISNYFKVDIRQVDFIGKEGNFCYIVRLPKNFPVSINKPNLKLYENGVELSYSNSSLEEIKNQGKGKYMHLNDKIYFSATDNSNPKKNGKLYKLICKDVAEEFYMYLKSKNEQINEIRLAMVYNSNAPEIYSKLSNIYIKWGETYNINKAH
ncbi:MAG: SGNH/GDSL hydrolase family protein [Desulfobacterales bacterium]|nr:SGNH/GDSL hydrolase family protein [Desulfobacterales bacterium]